MSILNVEHLTHGFGDRAIFSDVSFRLLKGEHIGLVGANGEGKSTFMRIPQSLRDLLRFARQMQSASADIFLMHLVASSRSVFM